jgi:protein-tyrosine phosphatase
LAKEENLPAVIHCSAGKDRTGLVAALIQLLVGIPYEVVIEDYVRTNDYFASRLDRFIRIMRVLTLFQVSPERMRLILMAHPEFLNEVHDAIVGAYGSVERYLVEACAIDERVLHELKARLLA